ncbi:hypothetical protein MLD38_030670 [Melastoma candidum]|uniref:Uncharacterized protein n=1 Tax=Melastoma candidum TaxID=119954 RepID=A0ACB9MNJ8_9MYRT|nr:hypothetical protein MLD38_030670 [Melastoma candidum]
MHPSRSPPCAPPAAIAIALLLIIFFSLLPFVTVGSSSYDGLHEQRKTVLGSRPPRCINKCLSCKPCLPTLVVQGTRVEKTTMSGDEYYLLAWKCRCGNRLFQP